MLKAGEFSPNNPLTRGERTSGDALLGLGEYERRRNTLRRMRQQQYREYLDQQAKKKQESKEQAERERRDREEKEREREERERQLESEREERERERQREDRERERRLIELERHSPERRRVSVSYGSYNGANKVDTAVQVDSRSVPLSVAVQTDETDIFRLGSPSKCQLTQAERELSPHTVLEGRRRSCGDFAERQVAMTSKNSDKMCSSLRHSYMPSIFDADAIHLRNVQAEKEAAARRQFYQQELRNQIMEQQRIKEERKTREKMLEQAEMRRLEEQLRMLRVAQDKEIGKQQQMDSLLKEQTMEYDKKRMELQKEIDTEQRVLRAPLKHTVSSRNICTSRSETDHLPSYYSKIEKERKPYSTNIPDDSIFSPNYDVDSYLRRNLNFKERYEYKNDYDIESIGQYENVKNVEKVLIHEQPKPKNVDPNPIPKERKMPIQNSIDTLPIPVLRHSPVLQSDKVESNPNLSDAMKKVDDKWKVPVVQKNILKSVPNIDGKNVSILTQLGSIRRQLQLEQLKLDRMSKDED